VFAALLFATSLVTAPPSSSTKVRVLVLDFKPSGGVDANVVENITGLAAAVLSEDARLEVLAGPDLRQMIDLQAQKSDSGCDTNASSCIAELAGALDAKLVVIGNVGYLGDLLNLNLVLFDQATGQNAGRRAVQAKNLSELSTSMRAPLKNLIGSALGDAPVEAAPAQSSSSTGLYALIGGAGAVVVGGVLLGVGAFPVFAVNGEEANFVKGDANALGRAVELQTTWFDSGLSTGFLIGGGVLVLAGGGAIAAGLMMGVE
jgi:hypothetical protein